MSNPDPYFKDKLYDLETPLGGNVSFEKVMAMRKKQGFPIWWKPAVLVVATLSVVSLTGYFLKNTGTSQFNINNGQVANQHAANQTHSNPPQNDMDAAAAKNNADQNVSSNNNANEQGRFASARPNATKIKRATNRLTTPKVSAVAEGDAGAAVSKSPWLSNNLRPFGLRLFSEKNNFELALLDPKLKYTEVNAKNVNVIPFVELMMNTGGSNSGFSGNAAYTVQGNHYFGQYSAIALWNAKAGLQLGLGLGFGQFMGNGEWRSLNQYDKLKIDTNTITIIQPGFPNKVVTVYDTTTVQVKEVKTGNLSYRMNKVSLPIAIRYHIGEGRTILRLSGTVAPGILTSASGIMFNEKNSSPVTNQKSATLDAKMGVGIHYLLSRNLAVIAEPGLTYQSIYGSNWNAYNRISFGFGLGVVFKP